MRLHHPFPSPEGEGLNPERDNQVHFIGVGEGVNDLEAFEARDFARAIAGLED